jgi:hypothetical protein
MECGKGVLVSTWHLFVDLSIGKNQTRNYMPTTNHTTLPRVVESEQ